MTKKRYVSSVRGIRSSTDSPRIRIAAAVKSVAMASEPVALGKENRRVPARRSMKECNPGTAPTRCARGHRMEGRLLHARQHAREDFHEGVLPFDAVTLVQDRLADDAHHLVELILDPVDGIPGFLDSRLQVQDDFYPGQVHSEVTREGEDHLQLPD